jgi:putative ABC transport system substrate-binding protein
MRRRDFLRGLGGVAAWPFAAQAQDNRVRRVGVLINLSEGDTVTKARLAIFEKVLGELGWTQGRNLQIVYRFGEGENARIRKHAAELVALAPDVILANASPSVAPLKQLTDSIPIVFVNVIDPVGAGFVSSLAKPGGNATGFSIFEFGISAKWLGLLKQVSPGLRRVAVLRDTASPTGIGQFGAIQSVAPAASVEVIPIGVRDATEIEAGVREFAQVANGGLIVPPSSAAFGLRRRITELAREFRLPAVYPFRVFVAGGGLMAYGPSPNEPFQRAAGYVDRILKGSKPSDLPVQESNKYDLSINLRVAKAMNITVPTSLLATADEVIE